MTFYENLSKTHYVACVGGGTYTESLVIPSSLDRRIESAITHESLVGKSVGTITPQCVVTPNERNDWIFPGIWLFAFGKGTKARHITDGLEHTIIISELLTVDGEGDTPDVSEDLRGCWTSGSMGASLYSHRTTPNSSEPDVINGCEADESAYQRLDRRLLCRQQPATGITAGDTYAAARSAHPGGVVAGRADGSVDFFSDEIDPAIWRAMATRAGND